MKLIDFRLMQISVGAVAAALLFSACGSTSSAAQRAPASQPQTVGTPYSLYTHCGVHEARIGHTFYVAEHPLDDGQGNPPPGWKNPYQAGTIATPSPGVAVFRDALGHVVRFHARPQATSFLHICS